MWTRLKAAAAIVTLSAAVAAAVAAQDAPRTVRDRVFSATQAARGEKLFESIEALSHELHFEHGS